MSYAVSILTVAAYGLVLIVVAFVLGILLLAGAVGIVAWVGGRIGKMQRSRSE